VWEEKPLLVKITEVKSAVYTDAANPGRREIAGTKVPLPVRACVQHCIGQLPATLLIEVSESGTPLSLCCPVVGSQCWTP
jgi:hypothetical protein